MIALARNKKPSKVKFDFSHASYDNVSPRLLHKTAKVLGLEVTRNMHFCDGSESMWDV